MSVEATWGNADHTTILMAFEPPWSWDDFHATSDEVFAMMREVEHRVDVITYNRIESRPPDSNALGHIQRFWKRRPPNMGVMIVVGANRFMERITEVFTKVFVGKQIVHFVGSMEEAAALAARLRAEEQAASAITTT